MREKLGKLNCSLNDTSELRKLIEENPELPLLILCGDKAWNGECGCYSQADVLRCAVETLTLYDDCWMDEDDYREKLADDLADEPEYKDLSDEEYYEMIDEAVKETEFIKVISICVG